MEKIVSGRPGYSNVPHLLHNSVQNSLFQTKQEPLQKEKQIPVFQKAVVIQDSYVFYDPNPGAKGYPKAIFQITKEDGQWSFESFSPSCQVSGKQHRTGKQILKGGQTIWLQNQPFLFYPPFLFTARNVPGEEAVFSGKLLPLTTPVTISSLDLEPKTWKWSLQAPQFAAPAMKSHWFSMMGPSLMMASTSLLSSLAMLAMNPDAGAMVLTSSISSLSMAAAFLMSGLINQRLNQKGSAAQSQGQLEYYRKYLEGEKEKIERHLYVHTRDLLEQWQLITKMDPALYQKQRGKDWSFPVGLWRIPSVAFDPIQIGWQHENEPAARALAAFLEQNQKALQWKTFSKGEILYLPACSASELQSLFACWIWLCGCRDTKWIFATDSMPVPDLFWHPACQLDGRKLRFSDADSLREFLDSHLGQDFIICTDMQTAIQSRQNCSWICVDADQEKLMESSFWAMSHLATQIQADPVRLRQSALPEYETSNSDGWNPLLFNPHTRWQDFHSKQAHLKVQLARDVLWDLEKDGPHVLVAGSTGSGKSEGMSTLLLQLVLHNDSSLLQYVLVDFKGGAFGSAFYQFPHFAGSLTNLDDGQFERFERAMKLELERRQRKLARLALEHPFEEANLTNWNRFYPEDPISHLFLITDETAQLKHQYPQAMATLIQTAQTGRSLGIHLILACQHPNGVVDEQILANVKSRLCFKVLTPQDSRAILHHEKAAELKEAGQFILQKGQDAEVCSKALYARDPLIDGFCFRMTDQSGELVYENQPAITPMEKISNLIVQENREHNWVLYPLEKPWLPQTAIACLDEIIGVSPVMPQAGKTWWIVSGNHQNEIILQMAQKSQMSCYLVQNEEASTALIGENGLEEHIRPVKPEHLWQLLYTKEPCTVLVSDAALLDFELIRLLDQADHISLVLFGKQSDARLDQILNQPFKIAFDLPDRQEQYLFFGQSMTSTPSWPHFVCLNENRLEQGIFIESPAVPQGQKAGIKIKPAFLPRWISNPVRTEDLDYLPMPFLLGFQAKGQLPLFWPKKRPLVLAYATRQGEEMAELIQTLFLWQDPMLSCNEWGKKADLILLDLQKETTISPERIAELSRMDLCFLGDGFGSVCWKIQKPNVETAGLQGIYMQEGKTILFDPLQIKQER